MKKFTTILLACIMLLSVFVFVGCDSEFDSTDLLNRIDQLERELEEARELGGLPGPAGQTPHIGSNGNWWIGTQDTGVRAQGPSGPPGSGTTPEERIHQIGETFTYVTHSGLRLFSIRVELSLQDPNETVHLHITNLNMPGYAPGQFVMVRSLQSDGTFATSTFTGNVLSLNETVAHGAPSTGTHIWIGWPTGVAWNTMIPYVIFQVR
ncbi:MAG: hypothetical protein FWE22_00770 [Firmicutes bacterium]|nr:hypothetical protein [Bacillota bacterium]